MRTRQNIFRRADRGITNPGQHAAHADVWRAPDRRRACEPPKLANTNMKHKKKVFPKGLTVHKHLI